MRAIVTSILLAMSMSVLAEDKAEVAPEPEAKVEQSSAASRAWEATKHKWKDLKESVEEYFEEKEKEKKDHELDLAPENEGETNVTTTIIASEDATQLVEEVKEAAVPDHVKD